MARAFSGAFLAFAVAYTLLAFELPFMASGRIGPGFFPQILGVSFIVISAHTLVRDVREPAEDDASGDHRGTVGLVLLTPDLLSYERGTMTFSRNSGRSSRRAYQSSRLGVGGRSMSSWNHR